MIRSENTAPASEFAPFDLRRQRWPEGMAEIYQGFAAQLSDRAITMSPRTIQEIILLPHSTWKTESDSLEVYAFGSFRSHAPTILRLAEITAPIYMEYAVLPLIRPLFKTEWAEIVQRRSKLFRRIARAGLVTYRRSQNE